jgi:hypothetical protein
MTTIPDYQRARQNFDVLTAAEKAAAICRMVDEGHSEYAISAATQLAVEQVRGILSERRNVTRQW